jgi:hypothetical protein
MLRSFTDLGYYTGTCHSAALLWHHIGHFINELVPKIQN